MSETKHKRFAEVDRDIYEVANQLEGYIDESTPEPLAKFLRREGHAAANLANTIVALRTVIAVDKAEIARLKLEREAAAQATAQTASLADGWHDVASQAAHDFAALKAERDGLLDALKPFANPVDGERYWLDDALVYSDWPGVTFGDIRRARAALAKARGKP